MNVIAAGLCLSANARRGWRTACAALLLAATLWGGAVAATEARTTDPAAPPAMIKVAATPNDTSAGDALRGADLPGLPKAKVPAVDPTDAAARDTSALLAEGWRLLQLEALLDVPLALDIERPAVLQAQESQPGVMSLEEALETGASFSLDARISLAQEDAQRYAATAAWRQLGPKLDFRVGAGFGKYDSVVGPTPSASRGDNALTLRQPLFDWSTWQEAQRQAQNAVAASYTRGSAQSQAALDAGSGFLAVLQSGLIVSYTREYETLLQKLLQYMEVRAEVGGASPADFERVRGRVENAKATLSENRAGLVTNLAQFVRTTGTLPQRIEVQHLPTLSLPPAVGDALEAAMAENLDIQAARQVARAAGLEHRAAAGKLMPRLDLEVSRTESYNPTGTIGTQTDSRVLVIMSWNVFNSGVDVAQRSALAAKQTEYDLRLENAQRRLREQLENAYSVLDSIQQRFVAVREEVRANRTVLAAFSEQLFATNRQLLDVLDAYQRYYQSKVDFTNLVVTEAKLRLQVAHLLGRLRRVEAPPES